MFHVKIEAKEGKKQICGIESLKTQEICDWRFYAFPNFTIFGWEDK